jgi:hypothetical protein
MTFKQKVSSVLLNLPGWHTSRKIIVVESDDWGSIRMPSKEVFNRLVKEGHRLDNLSFNRYDSLASTEDLKSLYDVLMSIENEKKDHPVFTANTIVANPDFDKIRETEYTEYHYELFSETLNRYPEHKDAFEMWKYGINQNVFIPQFHGREHLNVHRWLNSLHANTGKSRLAFDNYMFDFSEDNTLSENTFVDAFNSRGINEIDFVKQSIIDGLAIFEQLFGYSSKTMIAPCYIWSDELEETMWKSGIIGIQGGYFQLQPKGTNSDKFKKTFNYTGKKNKFKQVYLNRNIFFEPSSQPSYDWIGDNMKRIEFIFQMNKPVILSTHRLNYIGYIQKDNRERNLELLKEFFDKVVEKYPDVEFMTSDKLVELINEK